MGVSVDMDVFCHETVGGISIDAFQSDASGCPSVSLWP